MINNQNMWKRFRLNSKHIVKRTVSWTAVIYAVLGFIATFVPFDELLSLLGIEGFWCQVLASVLILAIVFILCLIVAAVCVLGKKKVKVLDLHNGKAAYVVYGNVFSDKWVKSDKRRYVCFAVNRCFDTVVDERLITTNSAHGDAFDRLYKEERFTPQSLNEAIRKAIPKGSKFEEVKEEEKPDGNRKRYEVGTCVDFEVTKTLHYFMVAIGKMDASFKNHAEPEEYCFAVQKLIEFIDTYSQGFPVLLPILGAGLTRLPASEEDLLKYLIQAFAINADSINSDIYIVVKEDARNRIAIADL